MGPEGSKGSVPPWLRELAAAAETMEMSPRLCRPRVRRLPARQAAPAVLAGRFGHRTAALVAAVTNPVWEPGRDEHEQYREHVLASLAASP